MYGTLLLLVSDLSLNHLTIPAVLSFMDEFRVLQQKQRSVPLFLGDFLHLSVSEELISFHFEETDTDLALLVCSYFCLGM